MASDSNSYKSMAKSSGIVAFVQVFQMFFGLLRNKVVALLIGTAGFGVWSLYNTFISMVSSFSEFGLASSGVREIAKSSDDKRKISECIYTFRITILAFSVFCSILILIFSKEISNYLFNTVDYYWGVRFLSITIIANGIARGGYAILNGLHKMKFLAYSQILGAIAGSLGTIIIVYFGGVTYVPLALSVVIFTLAISTSYYVHKLGIKSIFPGKKKFLKYLKTLVYLGVGFTIAGVISTLMTLLSRGYLSSHYDLSAVGIYQASWTISNLYIGVLLSAMGVDFLPRISKASDDYGKMNKMINEQVNFALPLAAIGVAVILLFSKYILQILYSSEFEVGIYIIRWQILGVLLRILAFPFSYSIMAKGKPLHYALIQIIFWISDYLLLILFSSLWGFNALGINYFVAYIGYFTMSYFIAKKIHSFKYSKETLIIILKCFLFIALSWIAANVLEGVYSFIVGGILILIYSIRLNRHIEKLFGVGIIGFCSRLFRKRK